ncbi:glutamate--tRNA ligase [candidate division KSB1 bacterium]|nr:MAG: glutamate--tRNA ligase [candidate division KSB1 bacterium]
MGENDKSEVRVRFAPSPTGYLHIGGARTAIFNWLFAKSKKGKFLLRIEDTNVVRSSQQMVEAILESLKWLGLNWDGEVWFQSKRLEVYQKIAEDLVRQRKAYYCYCERPDEERRPEEEISSCKCYLLTVKEKERLKQEGKPHAVRFWIPEGSTIFEDRVYGKVEFDNAELENFVILRSDGFPTYHLAVVVDDHEMGITHVIRGDDHLSNTPKHILLYQALDWTLPEFAHVPLILGTDKKRLSKRHGAASIIEYKNAGILPEAMVNYLALLGWSPRDDREIMSISELIESFSLEGISRKSAVFDPQKLEWINSEHLKNYPSDKLLELITPYLKNANLISDEDLIEKREYLIKVLDLFKSRMKTLKDLARYGRYFFVDPERYEEKALRRYWGGRATNEYLSKLHNRLAQLDDFQASVIEKTMRDLADELNITAAQLIHPTRIVLTGFAVSPGLFEMMEVLGKETVLRRLEKGIKNI